MPRKDYVFDGTLWRSPYGTINPDQDTTGELRDGTPVGLDLGVTLDEYNAPGTTGNVFVSGSIENAIIHGRIKWSTNTTLTNCWVRGSAAPTLTGDEGCIDGNGSTGVLTATRCLVEPRVETNGRNCVLGKNVTLRQTHLRHGVDGIGFYSTSGPGTQANMDILEVLIEDLAYFYPDLITVSHDDGVHQDPAQGQGGDGNWFRRVDFRGTAHLGPGSAGNPKKPWLLPAGWANGAGLLVQNNTGAGFTPAGTIIENCWFAGGLTHLSVKPNVSFTFRNNLHYWDVANNTNPKYSRYFERFDQLSTNTVVGLTDTQTNRWIDGPMAGDLLTMANGGIATDV